MNKKIILSTVSLALFLSTLYLGCGDDSTTNSTNSGNPNIDIKVGAMYHFTNDSLPSSGGSQRTRIITRDNVLSEGTYYGYSNSWKILSISTDTVFGITIERDTLYLSYDSSGGKFYQYAITHLLNPNLPEQWNLVADFSVAQGTQWSIGSFDTTISGVPLHVDIKGKVAENTSIQTTANPTATVRCYRIEISATVTAPGPITVTTIYIDYYLGYSPPELLSNPSGPVRIKLRPFSIYTAAYPGFDRILQYASIP